MVGDKKVSIIIPLYNRKHLISRCVESVCRQTYRNLEIIVVDDGSTDGCEEVLEALQKADDRIIVIRKENGGVSSARNCGLDAATGDYVQFVDSDDTIMMNATEIAVRVLEEKQVDCVIFEIVLNTAIAAKACSQEPYAVYSSIVELMLDKGGTGGLCSPVNKVFKREKLGKIRFLENISWGEDMIFSLSYCTNAGAVCFLKTPLYVVYHEDADSLSSRYDERGFEDAKMQAEYLWNLYRSAPSPKLEKIICAYLWGCYMECVRKLCLKSRKPRRAIIEILETWSHDSYVEKIRAYARVAPWDCYCVKTNKYKWISFAVRFCMIKSRIAKKLKHIAAMVKN